MKYGKVESILINIPWSFLKSSPVTVTVQGIWLIAEPCIQNGNPEREKRLIRAARQNILSESSDKLLSQIFGAVQFNLQISVNDVHIRFEDDANKAACGLCVQSLTLQTTDRYVFILTWISRARGSNDVEACWIFYHYDFRNSLRDQLESLVNNVECKELISHTSCIPASTTHIPRANPSTTPTGSVRRFSSSEPG